MIITMKYYSYVCILLGQQTVTKLLLLGRSDSVNITLQSDATRWHHTKRQRVNLQITQSFQSQLIVIWICSIILILYFKAGIIIPFYMKCESLFPVSLRQNNS